MDALDKAIGGFNDLVISCFQVAEQGIIDPDGSCECRVHGTEKQPPFCKQGPFPHSRLPECGFFFVDGKRRGECRQCGMCCIIPRLYGSPYGMYDPNGKPCKYLKVKEARI